MKKIFSLIIFINIFFLFINNSNAESSIKNNILLTWSVLENNSWAWYWWKLVFPDDSINWVKIITTTYDLNTWNWDMWITWNFWLENLSNNTDNQMWRVTFDIWNVYFSWNSWPLVPKVTLKNKWWNQFIFEWYAWSNASWWIYFWDTWITNWSVIYNRTDGKINWCWWSQNIWWLCIDDFFLDTTPPLLQDFIKPFAANHEKTITIPEDISKIEITNWSSTAKTTYNTNSFTHDFRKAKSYEFIVTDKAWNSSSINIEVVSALPSFTLNTNNIWVTNASFFNNSTILEEKIWDWTQTHNLNYTINDTYWNPIINSTWIKNVEVEFWFSNNVDKDQITNLNLWDAIKYSNNPFWLISWILNWWIWSINVWTWYKTDANYNIDITSLAPTKAWYSYTNDENDLKINKFIVKVVALNWNTWVWETSPSWSSYIYNNDFKFTPVVSIFELSNDKNFKLKRDFESTFTWSISIKKTPASDIVSNIEIQHKLDTISWWQKKNHNISFQNLVATNWTQICSWYLKSNSDNTNYSNFYTLYDCYPDTYSNIINKNLFSYNISQNIIDWFKATPKVVLLGLSEFGITYSSSIKYDIWIDTIKYPSFTNTYNDWLDNGQIKISWIATNYEKNFWVTTDSDINFVWNLSKSKLLSLINKNAYKYTSIGNGNSVNGVYYTNSDYELTSWPVWVNTIIVNWWNLTISSDIEKIKWKAKSIIVLKSKNWLKWDIFIKNNVSFIWATLVTFKSIISWDWSIYYSDTWQADKQLFVKWSIISYNTIWWSSAATPKCPFYITSSCDLNISKRYDLNHFRSYSIYNWEPLNWSLHGADMSIDWYNKASMIIEYDSDIQLNPEKILLIN